MDEETKADPPRRRGPIVAAVATGVLGVGVLAGASVADTGRDAGTAGTQEVQQAPAPDDRRDGDCPWQDGERGPGGDQGTGGSGQGTGGDAAV